MAQIIGRVALSHGPQLYVPPELWPNILRREDAEAEKPGMREETTPEVMERRYAACQEDLDAIHRKVDELNPDVIVIIGDDQRENILADNTPPFVIYVGDEVDASTRVSHYHLGEGLTDTVTNYRVDVALGRSIIDTLLDSGFDPAWSTETRHEQGLGHAFGRPLHTTNADGRYAIVPIMVNTYYPPTSSPKRCVEFGRALAQALNDHDGSQRVLIMASGGLSHMVIDEGIDREFLKAVEAHDLDYMAAMDPGVLVGGTSEIRNWIIAAATSETAGDVIDYQPCYRTLSGVGCAMAFATW
ncbi:MAG: hypothetical protein IIC95_11440 [Chloroflexi bacterium]|nr:hypothetical protein [Chloroflexota bacterium]